MTFEVELITSNLKRGKKTTTKKERNGINVRNMENLRLEYKEVLNEFSKMKLEILVTTKTKKEETEHKKSWG